MGNGDKLRLTDFSQLLRIVFYKFANTKYRIKLNFQAIANIKDIKKAKCLKS